MGAEHPSDDKTVVSAKRDLATILSPGENRHDVFWQAVKDGQIQPIEVTPEQLVQRVIIEHDLSPEKAGQNNLMWRTERIGEQAIGLMFDVAYSMYHYWFQSSSRPEATGEAQIAISFRDGRLELAFEPANDPTQIKTVLAAALFALMERTAAGEFNPVSEMIRQMRMDWKP